MSQAGTGHSRGPGRFRMTPASVETFHYDPFAPDVMADPLPFYKVLRDEFPAYFIGSTRPGPSPASRTSGPSHDTEGHITSTEGT